MRSSQPADAGRRSPNVRFDSEFFSCDDSFLVAAAVGAPMLSVCFWWAAAGPWMRRTSRPMTTAARTRRSASQVELQPVSGKPAPRSGQGDHRGSPDTIPRTRSWRPKSRRRRTSACYDKAPEEKHEQNGSSTATAASATSSSGCSRPRTVTSRSISRTRRGRTWSS